MEAEQIAPINLEPQFAPAEQRHRKHLEEGCDHLSSAGHWLSKSESAYNDLEQAHVAYDERIKSLIQNDPKALELDEALRDRQNFSDLALRELEYHKTAAREAFATAYQAKPSGGKQLLGGNVSISIRRSTTGHWNADAAAEEGRAPVEKNRLLFPTLFAPIKLGFKKLIGMGIPASPEVMRIDETTVVNSYGGDDMIREFRNPYKQ